MIVGSGESAVALSGGRMTPGVMKVGGMVRRPMSPASRLTATLPAHLAEQGFDGAPRHLGRDGLGCAPLITLTTMIRRRSLAV